MATKRSAPHVHPSRQDQVPDEPRRKKQKPSYAGAFKKAHPVNELKSQVRSLKRLLEKNDRMPATVRQEKERALQTAQHELREAEKAKKKSDMIGRYHKIRFFDRKKAEKRLKRVRKELQACEGESEERARLGKVVEDAEVDVNYAQYFPLDKPYVSLFPRKNDGDDDEAGSQEQPDSERKGDETMWLKVKECMGNGKLDPLRNGKLEDVQLEDEEVRRKTSAERDGKRSRKQSAPNRTMEINGKSHSTHDNDDDDNESDGGFFE